MAAGVVARRQYGHVGRKSNNINGKMKTQKFKSISDQRKLIFDLGNINIIYVRLIAIFIGSLITYLIYWNYYKHLIFEKLTKVEFSLIFTLIVFILSYSKVYGTIMDIRELQRELVKLKISKLNWKINTISIFYILCFSLLVANVYNFFQFSICLILLSGIYLIFWGEAYHFFKQNIIETFKYNVANNNLVGKYQNKILINYFSGWRAKDVSMYVIISTALANLLILTPIETNFVKYSNINSVHLFPAVIILIGILISEGIVWTKRLKRKYQIRYLEQNSYLFRRNSK